MTTNFLPEKTSQCLICGEPIYANAKKCSACGSYQDWRRHFDISAVVLSLLVALVSVVSAVGPQIIALLPPWGSKLEIRSYYFSADAISIIVENRGNRPGHIGRVNFVTYCFGAYFNSDQGFTGVPSWGFEEELGTSPQTSRIVPERATREIQFALSRDMLFQAEKDFPTSNQYQYPAGDFRKVLYNESVRFMITAELWNSGANAPIIANVTAKPDPPFWRGFTTITQRP
jgi:hypothetical protein